MWGCCIRSQIFFPQIFGCIHRMQSFHVQQPASLYAKIDSLYFTYLCNIIFNSDTIAVCVPNGRWALTPPSPPTWANQTAILGRTFGPKIQSWILFKYTCTHANKVLPFHSRTLASTVVWLERDEGEGATDGRCPPSFLTKAGERGETMEGWRQKERIK